MHFLGGIFLEMTFSVMHRVESIRSIPISRDSFDEKYVNNEDYVQTYHLCIQLPLSYF